MHKFKPIRPPRFSIASLLLLTLTIAVGVAIWLSCQPPGAGVWDEVNPDLDAVYARKMFFGKSRREAELMFVGNSMARLEDIDSMPARCMHFYIHSYMDYLLSEAASGDSDGASCFLHLVEWRAAEIRDGGGRLVRRVQSVLSHIAEHQEWYDADRSIYGDFRETAAKARMLLEGE